MCRVAVAAGLAAIQSSQSCAAQPLPSPAVVRSLIFPRRVLASGQRSIPNNFPHSPGALERSCSMDLMRHRASMPSNMKMCSSPWIFPYFGLMYAYARKISSAMGISQDSTRIGGWSGMGVVSFFSRWTNPSKVIDSMRCWSISGRSSDAASLDNRANFR